MGCVISNCHTIGIVDDLALKSSIEVFPNPAKDKISFRWEPEGNLQSLAIYNIWGEKVTKAEVSANSSFFELQLNGFSPGVYIYYLQTKGGEFVNGKFVKN